MSDTRHEVLHILTPAMPFRISPTLRSVALAVAGLLAACGSEPPPAAPQAQRSTPVLITTVQPRPFEQAIEAVGTARARESVTLTSRVTGLLREIHFEEGATVSAGTLLVRFDDDEERAEVAAAEAGYEQARSRHQRLESLARRNLAAPDALDEQQQALKAARARLALAQARLAQREIRAPFAGTIGLRQVSPGALITPGVAIATLDDVSVMRATFEVPETLARFLAVGNRIDAVAAAWPEHRFAGRLRVIGTRVREDTRTLSVQAEFDNPGGRLRPGMLMVMDARAAPRQALFIPEAALTPEGGVQYVWRLRGDDTAERVVVAIGARLPGEVEITQGLAAGDRIVVEGTATLRTGRAVRVVGEAMAARPTDSGS